MSPESMVGPPFNNLLANLLPCPDHCPSASVRGSRCPGYRQDRPSILDPRPNSIKGGDCAPQVKNTVSRPAPRPKTTPSSNSKPQIVINQIAHRATAAVSGGQVSYNFYQYFHNFHRPLSVARKDTGILRLYRFVPDQEIESAYLTYTLLRMKSSKQSLSM